MGSEHTVADALVALAAGKAQQAAELLAPTGNETEVDAADQELATAIRRHLGSAAGTGGDVYVNPEAFARFIDAEPNVELYRATTEALSRWLSGTGATDVADIGCGDGRVSAAVADREGWTVELVEPSAAMLSQAAERFARASVNADQQTVQEWLATPRPSRLQAAWSTFAMHNLDDHTRADVLTAIGGRVERLAIIEFDIPIFAGIEDHARYCAERYRRGFADHADDVVRRGFLLPVLLGQFAPDATRHTHEQPLQRWAEQLTAAGFERVEVIPIHNQFWWGPAGMVVAESAG